MLFFFKKHFVIIGRNVKLCREKVKMLFRLCTHSHADNTKKQKRYAVISSTDCCCHVVVVVSIENDLLYDSKKSF